MAFSIVIVKFRSEFLEPSFAVGPNRQHRNPGAFKAAYRLLKKITSLVVARPIVSCCRNDNAHIKFAGEEGRSTC